MRWPQVELIVISSPLCSRNQAEMRDGKADAVFVLETGNGVGLMQMSDSLDVKHFIIE